MPPEIRMRAWKAGFAYQPATKVDDKLHDDKADVQEGLKFIVIHLAEALGNGSDHAGTCSISLSFPLPGFQHMDAVFVLLPPETRFTPRNGTPTGRARTGP